MALDRVALQDSARRHFVEKAQREIKSLINAWPQSLKFCFKSLNDVVRAGRKMEVTGATTFSEDEIAELVEELSPLAELEMRDEMCVILSPRFTEHGFGDDVLVAGFKAE